MQSCKQLDIHVESIDHIQFFNQHQMGVRYYDHFAKPYENDQPEDGENQPGLSPQEQENQVKNGQEEEKNGAVAQNVLDYMLTSDLCLNFQILAHPLKQRENMLRIVYFRQRVHDVFGGPNFNAFVNADMSVYDDNITRIAASESEHEKKTFPLPLHVEPESGIVLKILDKQTLFRSFLPSQIQMNFAHHMHAFRYQQLSQEEVHKAERNLSQCQFACV